jgi:hypothetical protein
MAAEHAFEIDSNVGRYWLAHGEGFDVVVERGPRLGVVTDVVVNPLTHEVSSVVVRRRLSARLRRPAKVPVGELRAVLPASRRFLVASNGATRTHPARTPRLRLATASAARATVRGTAGAARVTAGAARSTARSTAHGTEGALASVRATVRAHWPAVRQALAVAAAAVGDALAACAAVSAAVAEWSWQSAREHLRESGREIRSRASRAR